MGEYAGRPIGFNNKPIRRGMLYGDYTTEQIEAMVSAPDFEEKMAKAKHNMDEMTRLSLAIVDKEIAK